MVWNAGGAGEVRVDKTSQVNQVFRVWLFLFGILAVTPAQKDRGKSLGFPYFRVVTPAYPTSSTDTVRVDAIVKIPYDAIQFLKMENRFEAQYELSISVQTMDGNQLEGKIWSRSVNALRYNETISSQFFELEKASFFLRPGSYKYLFELKDMDTHKSGRQTFVVDLSRFSEKTALSDPVLVDPQDTSETFPYGTPVVPAEISDGQLKANIYFELRIPAEEYVLKTRVVSIKDEVLTELSDTSRSQQRVISRVVPYNLENIRENKFKVIMEAVANSASSTGELVIDVRWGGLTTHVRDVKEAIEQARYISTAEESRKIRRADEAKQKELFKKFWKERDPTPNTAANELMDEYYRRVEHANEKFGAFQDGWKTDMGMIFILFGPPDDMEVNLFARDGRSYQTWHYYVINRSFVFVDYNGFGEYELLEPYSSPYGYPRR